MTENKLLFEYKGFGKPTGDDWFFGPMGGLFPWGHAAGGSVKHHLFRFTGTPELLEKMRDKENKKAGA